MQNGFYAACFKTTFGTFHGVVVLRDGHFNGGDGSTYFYGTYSVDGYRFGGRARTGRHISETITQPIFGRELVTIELTGSFSRNVLTCDGKVVKPTGAAFTAKFKLISRNV
jgi:hypothetical protein